MLINTPKLDYSLIPDIGATELGIDNSYPIGLLLISSAIKSTGLYKVDYLDSNFYHLNSHQILRDVETARPKYIGMNVSFPNLHIVMSLANQIKSLNPQSKVILGGPAATLAADYILQNSLTDFVVIGEGEATIVDLLACLEHQINPIDLRGIAFNTRTDGIIRTLPRNPLPFNKIPFVDVENIPIEIKTQAKEVSLFTSRGCDAYCNFCSTPIIWGIGRANLRNCSTERIFLELKNYRERGFEFESVHFIDDSFLNDWSRVEKFLDAWNVSYRDEGVNWRCVSRIKSINSEYRINSLIESRCTHLSLGVESANNMILKKIGKGLRIEEVDKFLDYCTGKHLKKKAFFMIGFPDETEDHILETIRYVEKSTFDEIGVNIVIAYPGTRLYKEIYGNNFAKIPEFTQIDFSRIQSERVRNILRKYSTAPKESISKHVTIERLYELLVLSYETFFNTHPI